MSTLPPTTHALPQTHRARLIQSTRKLGALLGETPLLLEPQGHHSRNSSISSISSTTSNESNASKRSGRIFADAQPRSSSLAPADPALVSNATHAPRPVLLLRLASPRPTSMVSPISPSFQLSPITPTFVVDRRKKMAKLVRTLGTNVPPELVFSAAPKTAVPNRAVPAVMRGLSPAHGSHRRGMSDTSFASSTLASPTREAAHASQAYYASTSGIDDGWVDLGPSSYPPSPCSPRYVKASPTWDAAFADDMYVPARSASPLPRPSTTSRSTDDSRFLSRHYEFSVPSRANSPHPSSRPVSPYEDDDEPVATYRKEQGWSGEWSGAQGMEDVVKSLRRLK
ncbi:hypothetical protein DFH08DRAFT_842925 [Mycena albidolilacea]|uniref:Uncharacterized protein n=1 Tax=Mycena albidolilacea TaxID=1033008 RepID=A0AAD7F1M2_9AGAR|nr:hypothetical protein DFH08DRAFT_842925 [Mycena albidolilacea]